MMQDKQGECINYNKDLGDPFGDGIRDPFDDDSRYKHKGPTFEELADLPRLLEVRFEFISNVYWKIPIDVQDDLEDI